MSGGKVSNGGQYITNAGGNTTGYYTTGVTSGSQVQGAPTGYTYVTGPVYTTGVTSGSQVQGGATSTGYTYSTGAPVYTTNAGYIQ